jgi:hypothetical protein
VVPRAGLDRCGKSRPHRDSIPDRPARGQSLGTANMTGHGQHCSKFVICVVLFVIRIVLLLVVLFCVLFMCKCVLPPGVNPTAVDKYININTD